MGDFADTYREKTISGEEDAMEKRRFTRVPFRPMAYVRWRDRNLRGTVENLSLKGLLVRTEEQLPVGSVAEITIYLEGTRSRLDKSLNLRGEVRRCEEGGISMEFREMDVETFGYLRDVIAFNAGDGDRVTEEFCTAIARKRRTGG